MTLIQVDEALEQILAEVPLVGVERVPLADARDRIVAEEIFSEMDLPQQPLSSMDGFAVHAEDVITATESSPVQLPVVMNIAAGTEADRPLGRSEAARIMTGAPLPMGADAIVPIEDTDAFRAEPASTVQILKSAKRGAFVRAVGEEIRCGERILEKGSQLTPAALAVLATLGIAKPLLYQLPRVAIISTGDELLSIDQEITKAQIRESNSLMLAALVEECGGQALRFPIARDDLQEIRALFWNVLSQKPALIISSAGVSVGAADYIKDVLQELGRLNFWRINMRPGKPLVFGQVQHIPFFGLPGNPVSAHVTFDVFARPFLRKLGGSVAAGQRQPLMLVRAGEDFQSDGRQSYLRVNVEKRDQEWYAFATGTQSSAAVTSMLRADGLLIIEAGVREVKEGTLLKMRPLKSFPALAEARDP